MTLRETLTGIVERLDAIEKVLSQYSDASRAKDERERYNPQSVVAKITFDDASKEENQTEANRQYGTQEKIARYAFYAFCAALLYAGISYIQLYEMRIQTAQVFRQSDVENANASGETAQLFRQLNIAQLQTKAAQDQVAAITKQMREDQRAWIEISAPQGSWTIGQNLPLSTFVNVTNIGKTAARQLVVELVVEKLPIKQPPSLSFKLGVPRAIASQGVMFPGAPAITVSGSWSKAIPGTTKTQSIILSGTDIEELSNANAYYAVYARARYLDIFKVTHTS